MNKVQNFRVIHTKRADVSKKDVLYGSNEIDEAKHLKKGQVYDVSAVMIGDFNYFQRTGNFYVFNNHNFLSIVESLYKIHKRYEGFGKYGEEGSESQVAEASKSDVSAEFGDKTN